MWTINDFPAYANLSGWSTKGYMACPVCNGDTSSQPLRNKICYMGHRRYLSLDHPWRKSKKYDGNVETSDLPELLSGEDILKQLACLRLVKFGKHPNNVDNKRKRTKEELNWTKKSIFFELEYWSQLKIRYNLDVMHIEKNICDNILGTLLDIEGKTKDTYKARLDLADLKIRRELRLQPKGNKYIQPHACYTFKIDERNFFCKFLKLVKFPYGYAANISRNVNAKDGKISGLKTHDCHVLLQRLLPINVRPYLHNEICAKTLYVNDFYRLEKEVVLIHCKLESIYPPAFFDIMVHLVVHLPMEAKLDGPVAYQWMFPFERYLGTWKKYVRNKAKPEGSIAEAYVVNEALTFCSMYLGVIETKFNRPERNDDKGKNRKECALLIFSQKARHLGASQLIHLAENEFRKAYWYILNNLFYVDDYKFGTNWKVVQKIQHRHFWDIPKINDVEEGSRDTDDVYQENESSNVQWTVQEDDFESSQFHRVDVSVEEISACVIVDIEKQITNDQILDVEDEDETLKDYGSDNQETLKIQKKKRGITRRLKLDRLIKSANGKLHVDFSSGKPEGPKVGMLSTEIGIVVRSHAPLNVDKWEDIPKEQTQPLIDRVLGGSKSFDQHVKEMV
ncbi:hypothetical protein Dsin_013364 [Dipteronia sinensis]|uniref:DUF4218 domain-containing protein n=1 Tax=Dipteronia sinensis TaxID=43782 RepID=A0AAE0AL27_9ROSI|nr:hypothetical protein Dsin_013364 [Dipteronia sinensis]